MSSDLQDFLYEHLRSSYAFQIERADSIRDRVSFVAGFFTLTSGAAFTVLARFLEGSTAMSERLTNLFILMFGLAGALLVCSLVFISFVTVASWQYETITTATDTLNTARELQNYHRGSPNPDDLALRDLQGDLADRYARAADYNGGVNGRRLRLLGSAMRFTVAAALFLIPAAILAEISERSKAAVPIDVNVVAPVRLEN